MPPHLCGLAARRRNGILSKVARVGLTFGADRDPCPVPVELLRARGILCLRAGPR